MKFYQRLWLYVKNDADSIEQYFTGTVWPEFHALLQAIEEDEQKYLAPYAKQAVAMVVADGAALLSGAGWAAVIPQVTSQLVSLISQAGKGAEQVAGADIHAAVGAALANAQAAAGSVATTPPAASTPAAS